MTPRADAFLAQAKALGYEFPGMAGAVVGSQHADDRGYAGACEARQRQRWNATGKSRFATATANMGVPINETGNDYSPFHIDDLGLDAKRFVEPGPDRGERAEGRQDVANAAFLRGENPRVFYQLEHSFLPGTVNRSCYHEHTAIRVCCGPAGHVPGRVESPFRQPTDATNETEPLR